MIDESMNRVMTSKLRQYREYLYEKQAGICSLCGMHMDLKDAVLDHSHTTGRTRSVLHRGCNALDGKIFNALKRNGIGMDKLEGFLRNYLAYISEDYSKNPYHPKYRTEEEKKARRNKRAKERRRKKKEIS
jgi:hypothetical protein